MMASRTLLRPAESSIGLSRGLKTEDRGGELKEGKEGRGIQYSSGDRDEIG